VMFALQNAPMALLELPGLTLTPLDIESSTARFDLTLSLEETDQGLRGIWEYNRDLFEAVLVRRMDGHFHCLLEAIVADPAQHIAALPLLTHAERYQLLVAWNGTQIAYPHDQCLHELVEAQAAHRPAALALVCEVQHLTYGALNRRANKLAHHLRRLGVGPDGLVGLCVERSGEMLVGLLGILKAGGAYVPRAPTYPAERLAFMLADAQVPILVTQASLATALPSAARRLCLDTDWAAIAQHSEANLPRGA